jgi:hypothetical protein
MSGETLLFALAIEEEWRVPVPIPHPVSGDFLALCCAASRKEGMNMKLIWVLFAMPLAGLLCFFYVIGRRAR